MKMECKWSVFGVTEEQYRKMMEGKGIKFWGECHSEDAFVHVANFKFKNARIRFTDFTNEEGKDRTIEIIGRDNATIERLRKFIDSGPFLEIIQGNLGLSGTTILDL